MAYVNREPKTIISVTSAWDNRVINYGDNVSVVGSKYKDTIENGCYYDNSDAEKGGDGNDTIYGFDDKDTFTLDGLDFTSSYKKGIVSLKFADGGLISFKNFMATTFHIDNDTYKISGSKFKKQ